MFGKRGGGAGGAGDKGGFSKPLAMPPEAQNPTPPQQAAVHPPAAPQAPAPGAPVPPAAPVAGTMPPPVPQGGMVPPPAGGATAAPVPAPIPGQTSTSSVQVPAAPGQGGVIDVAGSSFVIPDVRIKQPPAEVHLQTDATVTATLPNTRERPPIC